MKIHIACIQDNHIVPRMSQWLAEKNGWSISDNTDPNADVNYFAPYTAYAAMKPVDTLKTGWFTHYELGNKAKTRIWIAAVDSFDLSLYTSDVYKLVAHATWGLTAKITAGIDQEHFNITKKRRAKGRIGVSGVGSARKGVGLVRRLYAEKFDIVAAGNNWDMPSKWIDYQDMPEFYNELDVYLCTATIEGIPAPPLEALACGCKIVVPYGVGIMDELQNYHGVFHYEKGDYDTMETAVYAAINAKVPRKECRISAEKYTIDAWCESHAKALELLK